jgi:hypothetical protein
MISSVGGVVGSISVMVACEHALASNAVKSNEVYRASWIRFVWVMFVLRFGTLRAGQVILLDVDFPPNKDPCQLDRGLS